MGRERKVGEGRGVQERGKGMDGGGKRWEREGGRVGPPS